MVKGKDRGRVGAGVTPPKTRNLKYKRSKAGPRKIKSLVLGLIPRGNPEVTSQEEKRGENLVLQRAWSWS